MDLVYINNIINSGDKTYAILQEVWNFMRFAVPIIIVLMSTIDFVVAIAKGEEEMKKAQKKLFQRLIFGVLLYVIPVLLDLIFSWTPIGSTSLN